MSSSQNQFTYNEEYVCKIPERLPEPEFYTISSDSDDSEDFKYSGKLLSSSESSCEEEEEDYFRRFRRSATPEFLDCNRNDDEEELIIPLETEDCDFGKVDLDERGQMVCTVCSIVFKSKMRYIIHRRRHLALDHFMCPVCFKGFCKLNQCQAHEYKEHQQIQDKEDPNGPKYSFRTRNARKTANFNEPVDVDEEDLICIVPSTCLYPYQGPNISNCYQPYNIELKYGRTERKSHSKIQSKFTLECQKQNKYFIAAKIAQIEKKLKLQQDGNALNEIAVARGRKSAPGTSRNEADFTSVSKPAFPHSTRRFSLLRDLHKKAIGPKCYFCSLCGFTSNGEEGIYEHQNDYHPEVPVCELMQFLCIDKSLRYKDPRNEASSGGGRRYKLSRAAKMGSEKQTKLEVEKEKRLKRIEKRKDAKLFRKRKHIPRLWEKVVGNLSKDEFMFAIGLSQTSDVLLGPRLNQSLMTSFFYRQRRREVGPIPMFKKSIRIPLKKMVPSINKRFFCCQHCEYYATSSTDVRRHRRTEHLKSLRQNTDSTEPSIVEVPKHNFKLLKKKRRMKGSHGSPLTSELHIHLEDISLKSNGTLGKSISPPPRKKIKVS